MIDYNIPGEMQRHFEALTERVQQLKIEAQQAASPEAKAKLLNDTKEVILSLGNIALFKMKRGDQA